MNNALQDVIQERHRQISAEGWAPEHDDEHDKGELAAAGSAYAHVAEEIQAYGRLISNAPAAPLAIRRFLVEAFRRSTPQPGEGRSSNPG